MKKVLLFLFALTVVLPAWAEDSAVAPAATEATTAQIAPATTTSGSISDETTAPQPMQLREIVLAAATAKPMLSYYPCPAGCIMMPCPAINRCCNYQTHQPC